jgi:hypothetical protein
VSPDPERQYPFAGVPGSSDPLVANDNALEPSGSYYTVVIAGASQTYKYNVLINHANGATQQLGNLIANQVQPSASMSQYLPLPSGTAEAGYVPVATGTGNQSQWSPGGSGGSGGYPATPVVSGTAAAGQVLTATSSTTATWETPSGGGGGSVNSVAAGDASIAVGGTASAPTVETGRLDQVASLHPPTAAVGMNGQKVTSLANGSASADAVAFGQLGSAAFQATTAFDASGAAASAASAAQTAAEAASLPLPTGTVTAGYVPVATGTGNATTWQAQSGGGSGGNIDGGSATTGMLPVGNIDGGGA